VKKRYFYDHGLPFSEKLGVNLVDIIDRIKLNKAGLIIVDGGVGEGKTTLALHCMDYVNKVHGFDPVALEKKFHPQLAMGGKQFTGFLRICYIKKMVIVSYDEAGDFNRRGALTRLNALLNRTFETFRGFQIIVLIILPVFSVLDNHLFDLGIPRGLLHCKGRTEKYGNFDSYSLAQMGWLRYWYDKLPKGSKHKCYSKVIPNFSGHFLDLEPDRSKRLDEISMEGKLKILQDSELEMEGLLNYIQIAKKLDRSVVWVRMAVGQLKIKHTKLIKRSKYFDQRALNILADKLDEIDERRKRK